MKKTVEKELHSEIVHRASKIHRGLFAGMHRSEVEGMAGAIEHGELLGHLLVHIGIELFLHKRIRKTGHVHGSTVGTAGDTFEKVHLTRSAIIHTTEGRTITQRPGDGTGLESEHALEFIQQHKRIQRRPIALVHESENRNATPFAHLEEFTRLRLDTFGSVDHHQRGVHGREHTVGVLGEIFMSGSIEQVDRIALVVELQHRGADRDTTLFFELHPVAGGGALVFSILHGTSKMNGISVEQELLGERGFTRIRMGDDGESAATRDFLKVRHARTSSRTKPANKAPRGPRGKRKTHRASAGFLASKCFH